MYGDPTVLVLVSKIRWVELLISNIVGKIGAYSNSRITFPWGAKGVEGARNEVGGVEIGTKLIRSSIITIITGTSIELVWTKLMIIGLIGIGTDLVVVKQTK